MLFSVVKNNLLISAILTILFHLCVQGEELTRVQSITEELVLTEEHAQELIEHIDTYQTALKAASDGWTVGALADSYITQAVTLYNSLPRETIPVVGMTREIPESDL